jgi:hypothetical protein
MRLLSVSFAVAETLHCATYVTLAPTTRFTVSLMCCGTDAEQVPPLAPLRGPRATVSPDGNASTIRAASAMVGPLFLKRRGRSGCRRVSPSSRRR